MLSGGSVLNNENKKQALLQASKKYGKENIIGGEMEGMGVYFEYKKPGVHDDQEGFLVLEGRGKAKFGDEEFDVYPGLAMIAPAGVLHVIKKDKDSCDVKVFWFHSAV